MFKKILKKDVPMCWVFFAVAFVFALFRHDYIATWLVAAGILVAFIFGANSKNLVN